MANLPSLWKSSFLGERQDPYRALESMRQEMDDMFQNFMRGTWDLSYPALTAARFQPLCDIQEKDTHFFLSFDVPGMTKDDVKVEMQGNQLHVYGERKQEHVEEKGRRFESERSYGAFERWLTLPANVKAEGIEARVENGVLQIAIPKSEVAKSKEIKVGEGKSGIFTKLLGKKEAA